MEKMTGNPGSTNILRFDAVIRQATLQASEWRGDTESLDLEGLVLETWTSQASLHSLNLGKNVR